MTMTRDAKFYFANLGADIARCAAAAVNGDAERYAASLRRAHLTLGHLHHAGRPEAYEEGLLLMRALEYAREDMRLETFTQQLNALLLPISQRVLAV
ncbi:MAG TPA: hypothetical protein VJK53_06200 [Candidatus Paceibacterota bacterium]